AGAGQAQGDGGAPRVLDPDRAAGVGEGEARAAEAGGQRVEVLAAGEGDRHVGEPQGGRARAGAAAVPAVHRDVVVVAAGRGEQGARMGADGGLEAEGVDVEAAGGAHVADLQVDVADDAGAHARGGADLVGQVLGEVLVRVDEQGVHRDLAVRPLPL